MLDELKHIIEIEGLKGSDGLDARRKALDHWISTYVSEIIIENNVIKKYLNQTEVDFLAQFQAFQIAEKLLEDHAMVSTEGNKIKVKVLVLNKEFPKNKDK